MRLDDWRFCAERRTLEGYVSDHPYIGDGTYLVIHGMSQPADGQTEVAHGEMKYELGVSYVTTWGNSEVWPL